MQVIARPVAIALALVVMFGLILLREVTSPSGEGYWTAMAAAPGGGLYLADEGRRQLLLLRPGAPTEMIGGTPAGIYRALAADGPNLLLGTVGNLYESTDSGRHWRAVLPGRFTAVSISGEHELAAAWAFGIFVSDDAGRSWSKATTPAGDTEVLALAPQGFAATLLGLLRSDDGGRTWRHVPGLPDQLTSVERLGDPLGLLQVGDWRGTVWTFSSVTGGVVGSTTYPGGVIALAGPVVATTAGIYPDRPGPLRGREVNEVVVSGGNYFAAAARGPVYYSRDGVGWALAG